MWEKKAAVGGRPPDGIFLNMLKMNGLSAARRISPQRRKKRSLRPIQRQVRRLYLRQIGAIVV